jgi:hypothetical protein
MPPKNNAIADYVDDWQQLLTAIIANASDLEPLETLRQQLATTLVEVQDFSSREKANRSERQQWTQKRQEAMVRGKDLASRLRSGLRLAYGSRTEKLVEFGALPLRPRKTAKKPAPLTTDPANETR